MVIATFQAIDKLDKARFFQKIFLLTKNSIKIILRILFLSLSNTNFQFVEKELVRRTYTAVEALLTIKRVGLLIKKNLLKRY